MAFIMLNKLIKGLNTYQTKPLDDESIAEKMGESYRNPNKLTVKLNGTVIYDQSF